MDWHVTAIPRKYGSGWTGYTWNREYFPDPARFLQKLHERGLHVTLNLHPADGVNAHEDAYPEMAAELGIDYENEEKIPFDAANPAFIEAYFKYLHHPNEEIGVDFWWIDWQQGNHSSIPGLDPLWLLNHEHFLDSGREGRLPMTFSRYAGTGSHRYPVGFSGDSVTSWESLRFQPYFTANASNVGYTWWSHDIGGHTGGSRSDEMMVRWVQFGVFSPIMRLHSTRSEFYGKEPWNYGMEAEKILTDFMRLRHRLIPYLYTMDYLTAQEGLPLLQPMYYRHDLPAAYSVPNEYYFGTEMIVCPITDPVDPRTKRAEFHAWIPDGIYFDFFSKNIYRGGKRLTFYRPLDRLPVLIPAGGIVPLAGDYMTSHISNPGILEIQVYHGADGSFSMTEDDCSGCQSAPTERALFRYQQDGRSMVFQMQADEENFRLIPKDREYRITIFGVQKPRKVQVYGEVEHYWKYETSEKALYVGVNGRSVREFEIRIEPEDMGVTGPDRLRQIFNLLQYAQIEYGLKDRIYDTVIRGGDTAQILASLAEQNVEQALYGAITELLMLEND